MLLSVAQRPEFSHPCIFKFDIADLLFFKEWLDEKHTMYLSHVRNAFLGEWRTKREIVIGKTDKLRSCQISDL